MAKVLVLAPFALLPVRGGNRARMFKLMQALKILGHDVHLAVVPRLSGPANWGMHVAEYGKANTHLLSYSGSGVVDTVRKRYARAYRWVMRQARSNRQHHWLKDERVRTGYGAALRELHDIHQFDCVVVEFTYMSRLLSYFPSTVHKVLDTHDIFADRHLRMASSVAGYTEVSMSAEAERAALNRADVIIAIQDKEADYFRDQVKVTKKVYSVSHFIEPAERLLPVASASATFLGADSKGNLDTLTYLINDILPLIVQQLPEFQLTVAGGISKHLVERPNVKIAGEVENIRDVFSQAPLLLSPTRVGTGIAIKLLDALAMGVPAVTSATGARGHGHIGSGLRVVPDNDAFAFATATVFLLKNPDELHKLSEEAANAAALWNARQFSQLQEAVPL